MVKITREKADRDFLGIKNENWMAAARDLRAHALMLYLYLASNANNFSLALSPAAIQEVIGMPTSTYHLQLGRGLCHQTSGTLSLRQLNNLRGFISLLSYLREHL